MNQYQNLIKDVLDNGYDSGDRTGTGTKSVFGRQVRFDLSKGFPIVTTKKTFWKGVLVELLWLMRGETNVKFLQERGVKIWDEWGQFVGDYPSDRLTGWVKNKDNVEGQDYTGNFSTVGLNAKRDSKEDKLRNAWVKIMKRCYDKTNHNYKNYGAVGVSVHKDWHDCRVFVEEVQTITNWDNKNNNWNSFELDKDYYNSKVYSKETCVWLDTKENNLYTKNTNAFKVTKDNVEHVFFSLKESSDKLNIPTSTLHRWKSEGYEQRNIEFEDLKREGYSYRYLFTNGDLGPVYGKSWRDWKSGLKDWKVEKMTELREDGTNKEKLTVEYNSLDQLTQVIERIKTNPNCRRLIVSAWNAPEIQNMALPPCHTFFQFYVRGGKLSCQLYQRSADLFLGVPFNIASYACLTHLVANECGLEVGEFVHTFGDLHLYNNHLDQAREVLKREPKKLPELTIHLDEGNLMTFVDRMCQDMTWKEIKEMIKLEGYEFHPAIKGDVSV